MPGAVVAPAQTLEPVMTLATPFHHTADFVVSDMRTTVVVESDTYNPSPYVSFTGTMEGGGQIVDRLREAATDLPDAGDVIELCDAWDELHLKEIATLTPEQADLLATVPDMLSRLDGERYGAAAVFDAIEDADFSNADDTIDSRAVIKRIEVLVGAFEAAGIDPAKLDHTAADHDAQGLEAAHPAHDLAEELKALRELESQAEGYSDWRYGATLIHHSYFLEYAQEFAEDIGAVKEGAEWPNNFIDWDRAADELKMDFTEVDFDGAAYWIR
jgi:hypothetical protein